jgi:hypothetical protein
MCNQSVGLIQSVIEKAGIPTTSVSLLREVSERVNPPRALFVDAPFGYPLGVENNVEIQTRITMAALELLKDAVPPAIMRDFPWTKIEEEPSPNSPHY